MIYCDNNLDIINTLSVSIRNKIEYMEQLQAVIKTKEEFQQFKNELSSVISKIAKTQRSHDGELLKLLGGFAMIRENMQWYEGRALFTDINDNGLLCHPEPH